MAFRALRDGSVVVPAMVDNREEVICPQCGEKMFARGGEHRARHFYHPDSGGSGGCTDSSDSESARHARCVALAVARLREVFDSSLHSCAPEVKLDVSQSGSGNSIRRADALLEFAGENEFFGEGLIIEIQHRNHSKDKRITTHDYLSAGYSVVWLESSDFGEDWLNYEIVDQKFASDDGEGFAVSVYHSLDFISCESFCHAGEHAWYTVPSYVLTCEDEYEICIGRGCEMRRVELDAGGYEYNPESITPPDLPLKVLRDAVVLETVQDFKEALSQQYRESVLEKVLAHREEIGECSGPKGFHEWQNPESLWGGAAEVSLRECRHCERYLLADLRGRRSESEYIIFSQRPLEEWDLLSLTGDPRDCFHRSHRKDQDWDECPECSISDPEKMYPSSPATW